MAKEEEVACPNPVLSHLQELQGEVVVVLILMVFPQKVVLRVVHQEVVGEVAFLYQLVLWLLL